MARFTDDCDPTSQPSARAIAQIFRCPHASHDSAYLATVGSIRTLHRRRPRPLLKVAGPPLPQPVVIGGEAPRSAQRTSRQRAGLRHGSSRGHRRREILSPFTPHPQLDVGLTQSRFQFLVLDLELQLTRTAPPSSLLQPLPASIQELLLPVMNRLFR